MGNKKYKILILISVVVIGLIILFFSLNKEKVYTLKTFFPDTKVTDVCEYVIRDGDTIFHGKFIRYNGKGNKIAEGNFVNNEPHGKCIYYFDNGVIESVHYRKNSKITLENTYYYSNGSIERYMLYDDFGIPDFEISYDEQGNMKKYKGYPLVEIFQYKFSHKEKFKIENEQLLKVGDILKYKYLLANIPNSKRDFKIENIGLDNTIIKRKITKIPPAEIDVEEVLTKRGINEITASVKYILSDNKKTVIKDTVSFEVNVY